MTVYEQTTVTPARGGLTRRVRPLVFFVVSRERPDRFESLTRAFGSDRDVRVIFDRRRIDRRQHDRTPVTDRRRRDRRSGLREWAVRTTGWVRVPMADEFSARRRPSREGVFHDAG